VLLGDSYCGRRYDGDAMTMERERLTDEQVDAEIWKVWQATKGVKSIYEREIARHFYALGLANRPAAEPHTMMERVAALEQLVGKQAHTPSEYRPRFAELQAILTARDHGLTKDHDFFSQLQAWAWSVYIEEKQ
jgi:hypothetical protein